MQIALSKESDVPVKQQLADQVVFLITTGQLNAGDEMPSVRALGRQNGVHHNTVSEAYQELVRRGWLTRRPGSRLVVGKGHGKPALTTHDLDDLINYSIQRARQMGFDLQALRVRVRERLLAEPPDHLLVVEEEPGLREIMRQEVEESLGWTARGCSYTEFSSEPGLAIGAQVMVANHLVESVKPIVPISRPAMGVVYSLASDHFAEVSRLKEPSIISLVSVSEGLLRMAKSVLAPAAGNKHILNEVLVASQDEPDVGGSDLAFCDTVTVNTVRARRKIHYQLISKECLSSLAAALASD